jgi:hypothetical protein
MTARVPEATYELRIGDETCDIQAHAGHLRTHQGAANLDATIVMRQDTLAAIASAAFEAPSRQADRLIAINANTAAVRRLLTPFNESTRRPVPHRTDRHREQPSTRHPGRQADRLTAIDRNGSSRTSIQRLAAHVVGSLCVGGTGSSMTTGMRRSVRLRYSS